MPLLYCGESPILFLITLNHHNFHTCEEAVTEVERDYGGTLQGLIKNQLHQMCRWMNGRQITGIC